MDAEALSASLRLGGGLFLACRRGIVVLAFVAAGCMMMIGLFQMGILRHLPEPPLPRLDADRVDSSPAAYRRVGLPMPDAYLGLVSYAITAALAALGGADRGLHWPWIPIIMGIKVAADAVQAGRLSWEQWSQHQAFCSWCLLAALATFVAVPLAIPESLDAIKRWLGP